MKVGNLLRLNSLGKYQYERPDGTLYHGEIIMLLKYLGHVSWEVLVDRRGEPKTEVWLVHKEYWDLIS